MVHFTCRAATLTEKDIYDIRKIESLHTLLEPEYSLCVIHDPQYSSSIANVRLLRITGHDAEGKPDAVFIGKCRTPDQGYIRSKLGKILQTPMLFVSWKKMGQHNFRLVCGSDVIAVFDTFDEALNAYLPKGFKPEFIYERNKSVMSLTGLSCMRRNRFKDLVSVLALKRNKGGA